MSVPAIIWDFNGTLFDDLKVSLKALNIMLVKRGKPPVPTVEAYRKIFGFPIRDYYIRAGMTFEKESYEEMAEDYISVYNRLAGECGLKKGLLPLLHELKNAGIGMYILSACEEKLLKRYTDKIGITSCFDGIYGTGDYLAPGKKDAALRLKKVIGEGASLLIGDTSYDGEMAVLLGAKALYVGWGHHGKERLSEEGLPVAETPEELGNRIRKEIGL